MSTAHTHTVTRTLTYTLKHTQSHEEAHTRSKPSHTSLAKNLHEKLILLCKCSRWQEGFGPGPGAVAGTGAGA